MDLRTVLLGFVAICAAAQTRGITNHPVSPVHRPAVSVRAPYFRGGYGGYWWPWSGSSTVVVKETQPEFQAPNAITNKDYVPEKLNPVMNEYPEGSLPAGRAFAPAQPKGACHVVFQDGSREDGDACDLQPNVLVYFARHNVRKRISLDQVNLDLTQFE